MALLASQLLCVAPALGQSIDTNRPGFSFSPNVVDVGAWQVESGVGYTRLDDGFSAWSAPSLEVRTGISGQWELFVASLGWGELRTPVEDISGFLDFTLGAKWRLSSRDARTLTALVLQVSAPAGSDEFTSDRWDPSVAFVWAHNAAFPVAGTVKLSEFSGGYQLDNGLKLPFSWGSGHSVFVEWEANLPEHGDNLHWLNSGYQWLPAQNIQLDLNAGLGLNNRTPDYRLGAGFSIVF
jgi:hypothetical protein